mmetsp:Transcript_5512/g.15358  ORF Transcript_5512/g.15358 Transcript_5512/m.15358 type:complete len:236 (+) Transcript_5512:123-830(+)|eukprot:CAMPEP_0117677388 /NCGR_PEP_ID=MMETSP0804-20121206/16718_1 /TAXON_ID=1074897 /ORGANISM="Tetraselmis astigmatica, Strain CCMP880" /LENGTH=235 /DNA_ID=CAMNT_0005486667 /DNA_START=82 /DNA_END=789 /DNA_ORIENTATION=-
MGPAKRWLPLESNPEVMNSFVEKLGADTSSWAFCDVFGLDPELLMMVPQPVLAVLMVFPITDQSEKAKDEEEERLSKAGQEVSPDLWYTRQTVGNACGTIGLLHAISNNTAVVPIADGSFLQRFLKECSSLNPEERAKFLEDPPPGAPDIEEAHQEAASAGDTAPPDDLENINLHFVAFVHKDGALYELDGRKKRPINHGPTSSETLLQDACKVAGEFMKRSESINFNLVALAPA